MNKIISKLLAARLAPLLPRLTVPNQSGFIKGRLISDNVLLAKELFHEIWKGVTSPNMVLKLDMEKAYDRVQWSFLIKILRKMGFSERGLGLIENCISPCWFSVLINGSVAGFFKSSRGLRQGDPISPSLFILAADYLSKLLDRLILRRKDMMYRTARYTMGISHLAYADDIMIFSQAQSSSILQLLECLKHYMEVSGQKVNVGKSCFYLDKKHQAWAREVREVLDPTKGAIKQIEQKMARFLWGSCDTSRKTHWIKWQTVCLPTDEGGLGIRSLADSVEAFSIKMWWRFREHDSLWAQYMYQKYCSISFPLVAYMSNRFSPMWRRLFKVGDLCREQVRWVVGNRNISFWHDSWVLDYPLANLCNSRQTRPSLKVNDLWEGEQWNERDLWVMAEEEGLPEEIVEKILQIPFDKRDRDRGRWKLTVNGQFTLASAWDLVRNRAGKRLIFEIIWERNEMVHRDKAFEVENIIRKVNMQLRNLVLAKVITPEQWRDCCPRLEVMSGAERVIRRRKVGRVQCWDQEEQVGGVVRDHEGEIVVAFSTGFEGGSAIEAEILAILAGVRLAKHHGSRLWIESDPNMVVKWLSEEQLGPAEFCTDLRMIRKELQGLEWRISDIFCSTPENL
ncbi:uncharacterized protein LOC121808994 [Salvia splendens]|uniref:uncharacterized protein LOC121808994 n=1 Tax=Salvia splendens TaxID=180675 RepID=UPI001C27154B|nr:uncharacterized protein LOC121808994 [Salvia splendens]